ncbi:MAG: tungsten formylmethanofuran dehydrogenase [Alphaproteobacteria bacterium]|nr:tungsten formylmethanofuran dehydrogenase [Alphaproteobacteria bacterium]
MSATAQAPATIGARAASLDEAVAAAAALLGRARAPVIAGLGTDIAGAQAAAALAARIDAVLDHAEAPALLRDLDAMRQGGLVLTTPAQARARADLVVLVGPGLGEAWPELPARLGLDQPPTLFPDRQRTVLPLDVSAAPAVRLGLLRALLAGRAVAAAPAERAALAPAVAAFSAAQYAVVVWSAARLEALAVDMLAGLIADRNARARCAGLPLSAPGNAAGVAQALGWESGFPVRVGFRDGIARHDPHRYDAARLVDSGEADAALWIDAFGNAAPPWRRLLPTVALTAAPLPAAPDVAIGVGRPGVDHDAVLYAAATAGLAAMRAQAPSAAPTVAAVLARISAAIAGPAC